MKNMRRYILAFLLGLVIAFLTAAAVGVFTRNEACLIMKGLSDAFLIPAVLLGGGGLLTVCGAGGIFDMLSFSSIKFIGLFRFKQDKKTKGPDFYEYRRVKDKKRRPQWFLVITGSAFLLLSFVFAGLYYTLK